MLSEKCEKVETLDGWMYVGCNVFRILIKNAGGDAGGNRMKFFYALAKEGLKVISHPGDEYIAVDIAD
jgi:hypothetical protein